MRTRDNGRPAFACISYTCARRSLISSARSGRCHRSRTNRFDIHVNRAEDAKELGLTGEVDRMTIVKHDRDRTRPSGRTARPESHWIRSVSQRRSFAPVIAVCSPRPRRGTPGPRSARCTPLGCPVV